MASALVASPSTTPTDVTASTTTIASTSTQIVAPKTVRNQVEDYFKDNPIMIKIAYCESRFRQFDKDGSIYRGKVNHNDVGVMQINTAYHEQTAERMNLDLSTTEGNMAYAKYLYEREGTTPWNSSSPCWKDEIAMK